MLQVQKVMPKLNVTVLKVFKINITLAKIAFPDADNKAFRWLRDE